MERRLRYSERKRLAETGSLGPPDHDTVPDAVTAAVTHLVTRLAEDPGMVGTAFANALQGACLDHFGWFDENMAHYRIAPSQVATTSVESFLDYAEILVEGANRVHRLRAGGARWEQAAEPEMESRLNALFDRHRFGYRIEGGEARKIGSPALDQVVVGPALLAVQRPGWEEVERSFREALRHQRGGPRRTTTPSPLRTPLWRQR